MTPETAATSALTEALAKVQAKLPEIRKSETAEVETKTGRKYTYSYADLAAISKAVLPLLGEHGLTWVTKPTLVDGRFVLAYKLAHISGEHEAGEYPLPSNGTPQELGSAITYARRYCLCSVTGVAPEQDDDDAAAASHRPQRDGDWDSARPVDRPTPEQSALYDDYCKHIAAAESQDALPPIWEQAKADFTAGKLMHQHGDLLRQAISDRSRELSGAPI